jgi:hypothetical protein
MFFPQVKLSSFFGVDLFCGAWAEILAELLTIPVSKTT